MSSVHTGRKYGFAQATTDIARLLADPKIDAVVIATRHNSHAQLVCDALKAGKHVYVEKPLALSREELAEIETVYESLGTKGANRLLMVGFNRRFAPQVQKIKTLLNAVQEPKVSSLPSMPGPFQKILESGQREGGGRIIGEACHFIDLLRYLAGGPITGLQPHISVASPPMGCATTRGPLHSPSQMVQSERCTTWQWASRFSKRTDRGFLRRPGPAA